MKKTKFINKSIDSRYESPLSEKKKCTICHKMKGDVKYRKLYDYIACEYEDVLCCSKCEDSISEDI